MAARLSQKRSNAAPTLRFISTSSPRLHLINRLGSIGQTRRYNPFVARKKLYSSRPVTHSRDPLVRMITRSTAPVFAFFRSSTQTTSPYICTTCRRHLHNASNRPPPYVPPPTPFVPDVNTFLTLIGRQLKEHASKFTSWEELFTLSSSQLQSRGLEPPRTRKYLLRWRGEVSTRRIRHWRRSEVRERGWSCGIEGL